MADIKDIKAEVDDVIAKLNRWAEKSGSLCNTMMTAGVAAGAYPGLAELEESKNKAESLRKALQDLKHRGKLDPEVLETEKKLDDALTKYYWLWHKCKENMNGQQ